MIQSISVNGEVHQIDYTTLANKPIIPAIPTVTSADQGKVLAVNSEGEWQPESLDPLPSVTSADQGKVLAVNSSGQWQPESLDIPEAIPSASTGRTGAALVVKSGCWTISSSLTEGQLIATNSRVSTLEEIIPRISELDIGKVLKVDTYGEWEFSSICDDLSAICESMRSEINSLKTRVYILEHGDGSTASSISGDKLSLLGTNVGVNGEKLSVTGSGFTVNGEKLSITEEV